MEHGDPPIGCAYGKFYPTSAYRDIQEAVIATNGKLQLKLSLNVREESIEENLELTGGITLTDFSKEFNEIEVSIYGLSLVDYQKFFPNI